MGKQRRGFAIERQSSPAAIRIHIVSRETLGQRRASPRDTITSDTSSGSGWHSQPAHFEYRPPARAYIVCTRSPWHTRYGAAITVCLIRLVNLIRSHDSNPRKRLLQKSRVGRRCAQSRQCLSPSPRTQPQRMNGRQGRTSHVCFT